MINPQVLSVSRLPPAAGSPMLSSPLLPVLRGLASIVYGQSGERKMECTWRRVLGATTWLAWLADTHIRTVYLCHAVDSCVPARSVV